MEHLVTPQEITKLGRPIGKVDEDKLRAFITETEQMYIKPALGDSLLLSLLNSDAEARESDARVSTLLNGGTFTDTNGELRSLLGLKVAVAYFVYAQLVMSGDFQSTRFGMVLKDNDYSSRISSKERSDHYNNTLEVANQYLKECVAYCRQVGLIKSGTKSVISSGGMTIRKIG